jgi:hypothetical protein
MSKAWERRGISLGTARALVNAGFLTVDDLHTADDLELATVPRVGPKSLALLYELMGRNMADAPRLSGKRLLPKRSPQAARTWYGNAQIDVAPARINGAQ